ncbi:MAG: glycoside hydrolase N-terminal domain-containing protein, partial [Solirubrobacterales bacterium]|nr:glycoside hydrolase N-terminal domain-containing protein [Solirubrobacterales bacterium]
PAFRPASADAGAPTLALVPEDRVTKLRYTAPGKESAILQEGLPFGNGRIGGLSTADPAADAFYLVDGSLWTGNLNDSLGDDGQFSYDTTNFGTLSLLSKTYLQLPGHAGANRYRRQLDLSNGLLSASYVLGGIRYRRDVYASHPDDVIVLHLTQSGGGSYSGALAFAGTHGETTAKVGRNAVGFSGTLANGLAYGAVALAAGVHGGSVSVSNGQLALENCPEVLIVICGGTNYIPDASRSFMDPGVDPLARSLAKVTGAARTGAKRLLANHVSDYRSLYDAMTIDFGSSSSAQRAMDTPARLAARAVDGAPADPELEASYVQFGRYLMITSTRDGLPSGLQGLWLDTNTPDWMADFHTDINIEMNNWLPDRAGLPGNFQAFADYCRSQLSSWTAVTKQLFNDPRNGFANTSGKVAGWTVGISTNPFGGSGWYWHPAGSAWISNQLYQHYEYTLDRNYLSSIYPLLKGACEFWEARLIPTEVNGRTVLVDDHDWSPEQGPTDARGITYAQEHCWQLFENYRQATTVLGVDSDYARTIGTLQSQLYLPQVSPTTGWLEEWMTPDDLGDPQHRHLSPLVGLFPGDRITKEQSPADLLAGVTNLLTARGMSSYGWGMAWRGICWARLKNADKAYQAFLTVLQPCVLGADGYNNGASINLLDQYSFTTSVTFQIDANFGTPALALETLLYSRPGLIELLPALPAGWAASGKVTGIGARGGFTVDLGWRDGKLTSATLHSKAGGQTTVSCGDWSRSVKVPAGRSVTVT